MKNSKKTQNLNGFQSKFNEIQKEVDKYLAYSHNRRIKVKISSTQCIIEDL